VTGNLQLAFAALCDIIISTVLCFNLWPGRRPDPRP
jgi:hypothetical protein